MVILMVGTIATLAVMKILLNAAMDLALVADTTATLAATSLPNAAMVTLMVVTIAIAAATRI